MIKYSSENKNCLTPNFVSSALSGLTHRFVLVLESEGRTYNDPTKKSPAANPPRFAIGGARATLDPRNAPISKLLPMTKHKLELPTGWEKVHQYIYVLQPSTDEHGWQYRSDWSDGPICDGDEPWVKANSPNLDVRRRLWMVTVVKKDYLADAKFRLSEALRTKQRGKIMEGELSRQETGALMKTWQKRYIVLLHDRLEIYSESKDLGGKKLAEFPISGCEVKMLFGVQCPGRDFAFSIRQGSGQLAAIFDAENREVRRRWVVALRYQLSLLHSDVNFPPFDYGPPSGEEPTTRVLMCGELQKQGGNIMKGWKTRFFQLTPIELQYFDKESLKGSMPIAGMILIADEKSNDFSLRQPSGKIVTIRAESSASKSMWTRTIARQIALQNEKLRRDDSGLSIDDQESTAGLSENFDDEIITAVSNEKSVLASEDGTPLSPSALNVSDILLNEASSPTRPSDSAVATDENGALVNDEAGLLGADVVEVAAEIEFDPNYIPAEIREEPCIMTELPVEEIPVEQFEGLEIAGEEAQEASEEPREQEGDNLESYDDGAASSSASNIRPTLNEEHSGAKATAEMLWGKNFKKDLSPSLKRLSGTAATSAAVAHKGPDFDYLGTRQGLSIASSTKVNVKTWIPKADVVAGPTPLQLMAEVRPLAKKQLKRESSGKITTEILKWEQLAKAKKEDLETPFSKT